MIQKIPPDVSPRILLDCLATKKKEITDGDELGRETSADIISKNLSKDDFLSGYLQKFLHRLLQKFCYGLLLLFHNTYFATSPGFFLDNLQ